MKYNIHVHNKNHPPKGWFPLFPTVVGFTGEGSAMRSLDGGVYITPGTGTAVCNL